MKRPLAYITAAWCGSDAENAKQAAQYCRSVYEAGFSPICPTLFHPLFLNDAIPEEHKSGIDMARNLLKRSHVLVVCGHMPLRPPRIRLLSLAAGAHSSITLTVPCRSSFLSSIGVPGLPTVTR